MYANSQSIWTIDSYDDCIRLDAGSPIKFQSRSMLPRVPSYPPYLISELALFCSYGVICSLWTLLWPVPDLQDNQSARSGPSCILTLGSIQQLQLLTAKLCSKHATVDFISVGKFRVALRTFPSSHSVQLAVSSSTVTGLWHAIRNTEFSNGIEIDCILANWI